MFSNTFPLFPSFAWNFSSFYWKIVMFPQKFLPDKKCVFKAEISLNVKIMKIRGNSWKCGKGKSAPPVWAESRLAPPTISLWRSTTRRESAKLLCTVNSLCRLVLVWLRMWKEVFSAVVVVVVGCRKLFCSC